jgi:hypothetical protein
MIKKLVIVVSVILGFAMMVYGPTATSEPGPSPEDKAKEDLTRVDYPSQRSMKWYGHFIRPQDTLESLFGKDWELVARFNRLDRRHAYPGMTIKVPYNMEDIRDYTPMPDEYQPAKRYGKYILINMGEQWLGAYEFGRLKFSMPAATGTDDHLTPTGVFRIDARHRYHTSSLYKTEDQQAQYPMDYAMRFYIGPDNVAYWIHARDLPGRPASHGCVGLFDEPMQNRMFDNPQKPKLHDSKRLYEWAVICDENGEDTGELELVTYGPVVEIVGSNPNRLSASRNMVAVQ